MIGGLMTTITIGLLQIMYGPLQNALQELTQCVIDSTFNGFGCEAYAPVPAPPPPPAPRPRSGPNLVPFGTPQFQGYRLDYCLTLNPPTGCGKPAADAFCRSQGLSEAVVFKQVDPVLIRASGTPPTKAIGDGEVCQVAPRDQNIRSCFFFEYITCRR